MPISIAIPREIMPEERVAIVPAVADKLAKMGCQIGLQAGAGQQSYLKDEAFKSAKIFSSEQELFQQSNVIIKVQPPTDEEINQMPEGAVLISFLYPHLRPGILKKLCEKKITCFALEMLPRTVSRAQNMDTLSTQAMTLGYKAVLIAADNCKYFLPMLATAAGTIRPAKVLVLGAGVAGLQAIATAKRLGAKIEAYDVRPETKQEAESLGAKFIESTVQAAGAGGYARELTEDEKRAQQDLLAKHIADSDILIATAGLPGKPAPKIVTKAMVEGMRPGSVIVDIMAEMGGNVELSKPGENVQHNGVTIIGTKNLASSLPVPGSETFAKNVLNFISPLIKEGELKIDWNDEVYTATAATRDGQVVNESLKKLVEG